MNWDKIRMQLEEALEAEVHMARWPIDRWLTREERGQCERQETVHAHDAEDGTGEPVQELFFVEQKAGEALLLAVHSRTLTEGERRLIRLMLGSAAPLEEGPVAAPDDEESSARQVSAWFRSQQEMGASQAELPDHLAAKLSLYSTRVPLLLYGDYATARRVNYQELKKLLESFFDTEITLIPLADKEWLILAPESVLAIDGAEERTDPVEEPKEELLAAVGHGLHEMLENEWVGECLVAVHYPLLPVKSLYATILQLRETMMLGRAYHVGAKMHTPWDLQLEKLIHTVPQGEKLMFLERVLKRLDVAFEPETLSTLDYFFQLDCNVSETAKRLYIHRNTLLYRLDKFKQETGLDVRTFNDAVLVKIAMLLYKVTKRA